MEDFEDPSGQGLNPVVLIADATYLDSTNSLDIEHSLTASTTMYLNTILVGNSEFFVILMVDAGFVMQR